MAERIRTLTLIGSFEPTRVISPFSSTRSSLICVASGMSPTSSRNIVPPWAYSNLPMRSAEASVNAPFTWPNSSLSRMFSLRAAQLSATNGLLLPRAVLVDRLGDQFLAGAGLALDQHAGVGRGDALEPLDHVAHLRAVADDALEAEPLVEPAIQLDVRPPQPRAFEPPSRRIARSWAMSSGFSR